MGNALDFLNKSKDTIRRGHHNAQCKEKQDKFIKEHGTKQMPDCDLQKEGATGNLRVNQQFHYGKTLPGYRSKQFAKRKQQPCQCCKTLYTPIRMRRRLTVQEKEAGRNEYSMWCTTCQRKGTKYRRTVENVGGFDQYQQIIEFIDNFPKITRKTNLEDLFIIKEARASVNKGYKLVQDKIDIIIDKAYKENQEFDDKPKHYKFDF